MRTTGATRKEGVPQASARPLTQRPDLRHLKDQARDQLKAGRATTLAKAQFQVVRQYGFARWSKLKAHVVSLQSVGQLKQAIDANDLDRLKELMTRHPKLHRAARLRPERAAHLGRRVPRAVRAAR